MLSAPHPPPLPLIPTPLSAPHPLRHERSAERSQKQHRYGARGCPEPRTHRGDTALPRAAPSSSSSSSSSASSSSLP